MQRARGFIDGCTNQVTLISWEAEPKGNKFELVIVKWIKLESVIQNEVIQKEINIIY